MCLATANLPASLTVNSLFPQSPRRTTKQPLLRGFRAVFETINDLPENMRWCGRRDSNSHTLRRQNLNLVCLPISPRPQTSKRKRQAVPGAPAYGVDDGVRTHDRRSHNPVLYQLSYAHHIALLVPEPKYGAPGRTRTCDHPLRRRMLYPAELRALYLHSVRSADLKLRLLKEVAFFVSHLTQQQAVLDKRGECYRGSKQSSTAN